MLESLRRGPCLWLFDVDGTLVAPSEAQMRAWRTALRDVFEVQVSPDSITPHLGQTFGEIVRGVVEAAGGFVQPPRILEALTVYTRQMQAALTTEPARPLAGAAELLRLLKATGSLVGVVTGNFRPEGELKLDGARLRALLDLVVYAEPETPAREHLIREAVRRAERLGFSGGPGRTIVVGDSVHDIRGAHRAGAQAIAVCTGVTPREQLAAAGPDLLVADLPALLTALRAARTGCRHVASSG